MNQYGLEIPYAYEGDGVTVVTPERAVRGMSYLCPSCNQVCTVRRGEVKVAHFAHLAENKSCSISRETYEHMKAKCVIYDVLSGDDTVFIDGITIWFPRSCEYGEIHYQPVKLDARLGNPIIEHPIPTGDGGWIRADVAIEKKDHPVKTIFIGAAIEKAMAKEMYQQTQNATLTKCANLTKTSQLTEICDWLTDV